MAFPTDEDTGGNVTGAPISIYILESRHEGGARGLSAGGRREAYASMGRARTPQVKRPTEHTSAPRARVQTIHTKIWRCGSSGERTAAGTKGGRSGAEELFLAQLSRHLRGQRSYRARS